jgi:GT2 family glycosyltransferase
MNRLSAKCLIEGFSVGKPDLIGVVTVTYNSGTVIGDFLQSLLNQSHSDFVLYVVDNASSDDTLAVLANYPDPRIMIMRNSENLGVAEGNNIGIRAALRDGCASVLLINNDTAFDADVLSKLSDGLDRHDCEMIAPKILYFDPSDKVWCAGGTFSRLRGLSRHFGFNQRDDGRFDRSGVVPYSPTCCMLIRKEVFAQVGLMDAKYFVYFDDTDFCLRAYRTKMKLFYLPTATIYHKVSSLVGIQSETALRYTTRNHVYYVMKNFRRWTMLYYWPVCQIRLIRKCLLANKRLRAFSLAEKAFCEGVSLLYSQSNHAESDPQCRSATVTSSG